MTSRRLFVVILLLWAGSARAQTEMKPNGSMVVQTFSTLDRSVVAVRAPLILRVDVYVSPAEAAPDVSKSLAAGRFDGLFSGVEVVRREPLPIRSDEPDGNVLVLSERFILRALRAGPIEVPAFAFEVGRETFATSPHRAHGYRVDQTFFDARYAVVPVLAETRDEHSRRIYRRNGSAFLVAPDAFVTSYHVVMDAPSVRLVLPNGRRIKTGRAWVVDPRRDVVVLAVNPKDTKDLVPLKLAGPVEIEDATNRSMADTDVAFTYGWPGGSQYSTAGARYEDVSLSPNERLWVSANPVRPGDSGGPLLDNNGDVLGVVTSGTVMGRQRDVLREEVCIASDPRPALRRRMDIKKPRSLKSINQDPEFLRQPHVQAFQISSLLATCRPDAERLRRWLAAFEMAMAQWDDPDPGLHFMQGMIYQMLGHEEDAATAYETTLDLHRGYFPASYMLAIHFLAARDFEMADHIFTRTQQFAPYAHLASYGRARSEMGLLHYEEAIPILESVLRYDAGFAPALYDLAVCRLVLGYDEQVPQLLVRLDGLSSVWANRLRRVIRTRALRPTVVQPLGRAEMPVIPIDSSEWEHAR